MTEQERLFAKVRQNLIDANLRRKFGKLLEWERPISLHNIGPGDPSVFENFEAELNSLLKAAKDALAACSNRDLANIAGEADKFDEFNADWWNAFMSGEVKSLRNKIPRKLILGLGHPDFAADITYWGQMSRYTLHEALTLSMGVDPTRISEKDLLKMQEEATSIRLLPAAQYLLDRRRLFRRAFRVGLGGYYPQGPKSLLDWFESISLEVHPDFTAALLKRALKPGETHPERVAQQLTNQERDTLLKLIAAMACEQYGYHPSQERSPSAARIGEDLQLIGQSMDPKTIRKWLKEAMKMVDNDYFVPKE